MDLVRKQKWDGAVRGYNLMNGYGPEWRWAPWKRRLFSAMKGTVLLLVVGPDQDIRCFPPGREITAVDIGDRMIAQARPKASQSDGRRDLRHLDVHELDYPEATSAQVSTSCTCCSVPDPVRGPRALGWVLNPGGTIGISE